MLRGEEFRCASSLRRLFPGLILFLGLAVCGCSSNSTTSYTIGGTVTGLSGGGLVLQNFGSNLAVNTNGSFTFAAGVAAGGPNSGTYNVTIASQPSNPPQTCQVANGSGTATANVTSIQVICTVNTFTIGGAVSGLSGSGLQLRDNGSNNLSVNANGGFTFSTTVASGGAYKVTVFTQPSGPAQTCVVTNGSGIATANVTNVQVTCSIANYTLGGVAVNLAGSGGGLQLQVNGGDTLPVNGNGTFVFSIPLTNGTSYTVSVSTQPSSPPQSCFVSNGTGVATANITSVVVNCGTSNWIWENGDNVVGQMGTYGSPGTPGARAGAVRWTDTSGNFWMFGGNGEDSTGANGPLNDLWEFTGGHWNFVSGSNLAGQKGTYTSPGTPGARDGAVGWTDAAGHFWMFGGQGYDSAGNFGFLSDLWEYIAGQWNFIGGSTTANKPGSYGHEGQAAASNIPGGRDGAVGWVDTQGNFWLFGGDGYASTGTVAGQLNDLWKLSGSGTGQWTWVSGSNEIDEPGIYDEGAGNNVPGARQFAVGWTDTAGNLWLFGGNGYDSAADLGFLNDIWEFSAGEWTWIGGADVANQPGSYGFTGITASGNSPGGRDFATAWTDASGHFWLSSGLGYDSQGNFGDLNDLWEFSAGQWTWMNGANVTGQKGSYGTEGAATAGNVPGARQSAVEWNDASGDFWIFGGNGFDSAGAQGFLNDLWEYKP